jgi:hypothetical protein
VVNEKRQEFPEDIADYQDETEDKDREEKVHDQLSSDIAMDQFHSGLYKLQSYKSYNVTTTNLKRLLKYWVSSPNHTNGCEWQEEM